MKPRTEKQLSRQRTPTLQFYKTRKGLHRWRLRGANGEIMCQGTSVKTFRACEEQFANSIIYVQEWDGEVPPAPRSGANVLYVYNRGELALTVERLA